MNKTKTFLPAAAALLVLPLGLAGMAGPAAAQPRQAVVAQASLIERFVMRPMGRLKAGDEVRFRVNGAANGRVYVDIPGVASGILLQETRAGVYEGSYTIRRTDNLDAFAQSTATLHRDGRRQVARVEARGNGRDDRWDNDDRPPRITDLAPAQHESVSERGRVRIAAKLDDPGRSGVDRDSVRLRVDGRDVTRDARITRDEVEYRADLRPGRHTAEVVVRDRAGNVTRRDWTFVVRDDVADARPPVQQHDALRLSTHGPMQVVNANRPTVVRGTTRAHSVVQVHVQALVLGTGVAPQAETTVRADSRGEFVARLPALNLGPQPTALDMRVTATPPAGDPFVEVLRLRHIP